MNLHEPPKWGTPKNTALKDLDWMPNGIVLVLDEDWQCLDIAQGRENRTCYVANGLRGHGQDCLRRGEGVQEHERVHGIGEGIYLCECGCHTEDEVAVYGTYLRDARDGNDTMYGRVHDEGDRYVLPGDQGLRMYWCRPCRQSEHHWTE